jgi:hypothetical protein
MALIRPISLKSLSLKPLYHGSGSMCIITTLIDYNNSVIALAQIRHRTACE